MDNQYFTGHKRVAFDEETAPFNDYLLIDTNDGELDAYGLTENAPLCLETLLNCVYCDCAEIEVYKHNFSSTNAQIKLDGRPPGSPVCWASCDFGFLPE